MSEFDGLNEQVQAAWISLNQAGDTPDSHRSLLCLQAAVDDIRSVDAALHGDASLEVTVTRHHHSFWNRNVQACTAKWGLRSGNAEKHEAAD